MAHYKNWQSKCKIYLLAMQDAASVTLTNLFNSNVAASELIEISPDLVTVTNKPTSNRN